MPGQRLVRRLTTACTTSAISVLLLLTVTLAGATVTSSAYAQPSDELLAVRVALSGEATKRLFALRVRRLIAIELDGIADVEDHAVGPLGKDVIRVWIDVPYPRRALIEVRRNGRSLARRALAIADFSPGVAARVVSIATAEMVRVQAMIGRGPSEPTPTPVEEDMADAPASFDASVVSMLTPEGDPFAMFGPELGLERRAPLSATLMTTQMLYGRLLAGTDRVRWLELGAAVDIRIPVAPRWRLRIGAKGGGALVQAPKAALINAAPGDDAWSARAGGLLAAEAALDGARASWLSFTAEPSAILRPLTIRDDSGALSELSGFSVIFAFGLVASPFSAAKPPEQAKTQAAPR